MGISQRSSRWAKKEGAVGLKVDDWRSEIGESWKTGGVGRRVHVKGGGTGSVDWTFG